MQKVIELQPENVICNKHRALAGTMRSVVHVVSWYQEVREIYRVSIPVIWSETVGLTTNRSETK